MSEAGRAANAVKQDVKASHISLRIYQLLNGINAKAERQRRFFMPSALTGVKERRAAFCGFGVSKTRRSGATA